MLGGCASTREAAAKHLPNFLVQAYDAPYGATHYMPYSPYTYMPSYGGVYYPLGKESDTGCGSADCGAAGASAALPNTASKPAPAAGGAQTIRKQ
jgi:hypothetical protein